jgi:hypothetical protein
MKTTKRLLSQSQIKSDLEERTKTSIMHKKPTLKKSFLNTSKSRSPNKRRTNQTHDTNVLMQDKSTIKEIVERESVQFKTHNLIEESIFLFEGIKQFEEEENKKTNKEKYEIVDKHELENLQKIDIQLKGQLKEQGELLLDHQKKYSKSVAELNPLQTGFKIREKIKNDDSNDLCLLYEDLKKSKIFTEKLEKMLNQVQKEKINMIKSLKRVYEDNPRIFPNDLLSFLNKLTSKKKTTSMRGDQTKRDFVSQEDFLKRNFREENLKTQIEYLKGQLEILNKKINNYN